MSDRYYAFIPKTTTHSKKLNSLPVTARWLYVVMIAERGYSRPFRFTYVDMQKITGFSPTTVRQAVKLLDENGFLDYEHGGLERNPNVYELVDGWLEREQAAEYRI